MNYKEALKTLDLPDPPKPNEVKKAYRKFALQFHPDKNPDDPAAVVQFRVCTEAYNYLISHVEEWAPKEAAPSTKGPVVDDFSDIFDDIFGFSRNERVLGFEDPQEMSVTLSELVHGVTKKERLQVFERCAACKGIGALKNSHATICTYCFGGGRIKLGEGFKKCPKCQGRGRHITHPCAICHGFGRIRKKALQKIHLAAGFALNTSYTVSTFSADSADSAHSVPDGASGQKFDVFVRLALFPSRVFAVESYDIVCEYPVGQTLAESGGTVKIPGPRGWVALTVPSQSREGLELCAANQGLQTGPSLPTKGNLRVHLKIVPDKRQEKEAELFLKKVAAEIPSLYRNKKSWWRRVFG